MSVWHQIHNEPHYDNFPLIIFFEFRFKTQCFCYDGIHVARSLKGNEKWLMFAYIHRENREVLVSQLNDIINIKSINKIS